MNLRLGDVAPDFEAVSTQGTLRFHDFVGPSWCVFFSHPKDFTPVCTTEIGYMARMQHEFQSRGVKLLGLSVDKIANHHRWESDIVEIMGCEVHFPIVEDPDLVIAKKYDMLHAESGGTADERTAADNFTARNLFIISPEKRIRFIVVYPTTTGRHFDEILRVIDSLHMEAKFGLATPAHWMPGDDLLVPASITYQDAVKRFPKGVKAVKPYFILTPDP